MANQEPANQSRQEAPPTWTSMLSNVMRMMIYYWIFKQVMSSFTKSSTPSPSSPTTPNPTQFFQPMWHFGTELSVYVSEEESVPKNGLIWKQDSIVFGDLKDTRSLSMEIPISNNVQNNGTLYAHIVITKQDKKDSLYFRKRLTRFHPRKKQNLKKNLMSKKGNESEEIEPDKDVIQSYWWPNVTIQMVALQDPLPSQTPPLVLSQVRLNDESTYYYPILTVNDFWMLRDNLIPINSTLESLHLSLSFNQIAFWKFQLYTQFTESFRLQNEVMGAQKEETDEIKRMLLETNPILLAVTFIVSLLHSIFDFLAFKNDIDFWKNRKDMEGLSFRTILLNVTFQSIIFLYLLDNDTSWMILISSGIGLLIEMWKIHKTVLIVKKDTFPFMYVPFQWELISREFVDRVKLSKKMEKTREYDQVGIFYTSLNLIL